MHTVSTATRVEFRDGAVHVTDADPFDAVMVRNARKVLAHAWDLLEQPNVTLRELTFATRMLAASLDDVLYLAAFEA